MAESHCKFAVLAGGGMRNLRYRRAAMCRFKFAVPIVVDMRDLRYRRLQYDMADLEFK